MLSKTQLFRCCAYLFQSRGYTTSFSHVPVLIEPTINHLLWSRRPDDVQNKYYVDCTFGNGGYSERILSASDKTRVLAIDLDKEATKPYAEKLRTRYDDRFTFYHGNYSQIGEFVKRYADDFDIERKPFIDGVVFDLGVSSMQFDDPERGFSFRTDRDGPLDMRMDRSSERQFTASEAIHNLSVQELTKVLYQYGEEKHANRIANAIFNYRTTKGRIHSTSQLAEIVKSAIPAKDQKTSINPATKTFQALRIYVNDELGHLKKALKQCAYVIKPGGHLCVVSFHSLEDRIVKEFMKGKNEDDEPLWLPVLREEKIITPPEEEVRENPRSRSAKLRVSSRTEASAY